MKVILISGQTYLYRREIKSLGGFWNKEFNGWLVPYSEKDNEKLFNLVNQHSFELSEIEIDFDPFKPMTIDELRAYRQAKADRKADRLLKQAESRDKEADILDRQVQPYVSDWSFVTQPITQNSGGRAFSRFRDKISNKIDKKYNLLNEADDLRERADRLRNSVSVKGDAERRRQAQREVNDSVIKIGSKVFDYSFGNGEVVKVNKISYSVKFDRLDVVIKQDKCRVKLCD